MVLVVLILAAWLVAGCGLALLLGGAVAHRDGRAASSLLVSVAAPALPAPRAERISAGGAAVLAPATVPA